LTKFILSTGSEVFIPHFLNGEKILKHEIILKKEKVSCFKVLMQDLQRSGLLFFKEW
jgi:hypothetical protein